MSHTYHLMCLECRLILDLGKIARLDEGGAPIPWQFTGWRDLDTSERIEGTSLWRVVEKFMILHRNHRLQILSESYLDRNDPEGSWARIDTVGEVMKAHPVPEPDDEMDALAVEARQHGKE
jgi:hypothetical protein